MFDVFICHATEDKDAVARPLAQSLSDAGVSVWYDEFSLELGDSLRRSIERGIAESRLGVVILSPRFFEKNWPQAELDGLFAKEMTGDKTILPVWHEIDRQEILTRSPILADRVAVSTADGLGPVTERILDVVRPDRSHRTTDGLTVSASPTSLRLHTAEWSVKTPVLVTNHSDSAVYNVGLKIAIEGNGVEAESVQIERDTKRTALEGMLAPIVLSPDLVRLNCIDSESREAVVVFIHTIEPNASRELVIRGTGPVDSTAKVEVWGFERKPSEILQQQDAMAMPFSLRESMRVKSIQVLLRRV
jgi:hypothetical protein